MNKKIILSLAFIFLSGIGVAQVYTWAHQGGSTGVDLAKEISIDGAGNIYTAGGFHGTANFEGMTVTANGGQDIFIAKYNSSGTILWVTSAGGALGDDLACYVVVDQSGNVFVTGFFRDTMIIASDTLVGPFLYNYFLAKYDANGNPQWARQLDATGYSIGNALCLNADGSHVYCGAYFTGQAIIGSDTMNCLGVEDAFIADFDSAGNFLWQRNCGGAGDDETQGIAFDPQGYIYQGGYFKGTGYFGADTHFSIGDKDVFIVKYDLSGNQLWSKSFGGPNIDAAGRLIVDAWNNLYFEASIGDNMQIGAFTFPGYGIRDVMIAKLDSAGNVLWARSGGGIQEDISFDVSVDNSGNAFLAGEYTGTASFEWINVSGSQKEMFITKYDSSGTIQWCISNGGAYDDYITSIAMAPGGGICVAGKFASTFNLGTTMLSTVGADDAYVAHLIDQASLITGKVYHDDNTNGVQDTNEAVLENAIVRVMPGNSYYNTDANGIYIAYADTGIFTITLASVNPYFTITPVTHAAYFLSNGLIDSLNNFGVTPVPGIKDLMVTLTESNYARAGFANTFYLDYSNRGTDTLSGLLTAVPDSNFLFTGSDVTPDFISGDTLSWNFSSLAPGEARTIRTFLVLDASTALGTQLVSYASGISSTGDTLLENNVDTLRQTVFGSYDPNDKQVAPAGDVTTIQVADGQWLNYTIRFQNTGNAEAVNIWIGDTLDQNVDIASFEVLSSSHAHTIEIAGQREVKFIFNNIHLIDSTTNELLSHGFVRYRVLAKTTLSIGDEVENTAHIYFDYNIPVATNTTLTQVVSPVAVSGPEAEKGSVLIYPNPSQGNSYLEFNLNKPGEALVAVYNSIGEKVFARELRLSETKSVFQLNTTNFPKGIYFIKVSSDDFTEVKKLILY